MEVKIAKTAGFCYGVKRAVDAVSKAVEDGNKKIYTYGPIVHNEQVVEELSKNGVKVINDIEHLKELASNGSLNEAVVVIRAHGVGNDVYDIINSCESINLIDATCPHVKKIHDIVREHYKKSETIIVTGSRIHPEVMGILGQIGGDAIVIENISDAENLTISPESHVCMVSQTTFNMQKFEDIVDILNKKVYYMNVINTICNATQRRQAEAKELSAECDAMIVIGGRNSSNTAKLYEICQSECDKTYYIQSLVDLKETLDNTVRCVGITAGASTPKSIIEEVLKYVRDEF